MRLRPVPLLVLLALLAWATAGWAVSGWRARAPALAALRAEVQTLERRAAQLAALPPAPRLAPLEMALGAWVATVPAQATVKLVAPPPAARSATGEAARAPAQALLAAAGPVPEVTGAEQLTLTLQLPRVDLEALGPALASLEAWQRRWPVELAAALWAPRARTLVIRLTLYGTRSALPGGPHAVAHPLPSPRLS